MCPSRTGGADGERGAQLPGRESALMRTEPHGLDWEEGGYQCERARVTPPQLEVWRGVARAREIAFNI